MAVRRRVFPEAFKREAVDRAAASNRPVNELAAELGLNDLVLRRWMTQFAPAPRHSGPRSTLSDRVDMAGSIETFAALSQASRWELFQLLLHAGPAGLARDTINLQLGLRSTAISAHLRVLEKAALIRVVPESWRIGNDWGTGVATFTVNYERLSHLLTVMIAELGEYAPEISRKIRRAPKHQRSLSKLPS